MNIKRWFTSILPQFTKGSVLEDVSSKRKKLKENILPIMEQLAKIHGKRKFKNEWVQNIDRRIDREADIRYQGNFIVGINEALKNSLDILDFIETQIQQNFEQDVVRDAMTVVRANSLQFLETIGMVSDYTPRLMIAVMAMEDLAGGNQEAADEITVGEFKWLDARFSNFITGIEILSMKKGDVEKKFKELPDLSMNADNIGIVESTIGANKLDPFKFGLIPIIGDVIYHVRMNMAERRVQSLKLAEEQKRMLEFKLLQLEQTEKGERDARLQKQIDYTRNRIEELTYMLEQEGMGDGRN